MGLWKNIKKKINEYKLNRRIARTKYIHVMFNDKFNKPFVEFLNSNFAVGEHLILVHPMGTFPVPEGENVFVIQKMKNIKFNGRKTEKVIFHSLFDLEFVDYLYTHPDILKEKAYWIIWGGDLYNAPADEKNTFIRKNFKGYVSSISGDEKLAQQKYQSEAKLYSASYTGPISRKTMQDARKKALESKREFIRILVNNSADETTLEAFDILEKFKDEKIIVSTILSYGQTQFNDEIIAAGKKIFKEKFEYLDTYKSPEEYSEYLAGIDILVMFQNRQQGSGNVFAASYFGKKVYVKSEITTFKFWTDRGLRLYDSNLIKDMDFKNFTALSEEDKQDIMTRASRHYDSDIRKNAWEKFFKD